MNRACRVGSVGILAVLVSALAAPAVLATPPAPHPAASAPNWLAPARTASPVSMATPEHEGPTGWRTALVLVLTAGLGTVAYYVRRKRQTSGPPLRGRIEVLGSARLGPKALAVITRVEGRTLLLGVTESSVTRLARLDPVGAEKRALSKPLAAIEEDLASATPASEPPLLRRSEQGASEASSKPPRRFRDLLWAAMGKPQDAPSEPSPAAEIAAETLDRIVHLPQHSPARASAPASRLAPMPRVEGQAAGLANRFRQGSS